MKKITQVRCALFRALLSRGAINQDRMNEVLLEEGIRNVCTQAVRRAIHHWVRKHSRELGPAKKRRAS